MSINTLYRNYFQKSKIFVYPLLDIKKGCSVTPVQTYFGWNDYVKPEDMKLVAVYHERKDQDYINFEKNVLLKHNRLSDFVKLNDTEVLYTFDFSDIGDDWMNIINGRYSKMNPTIKRKIRDHFDKNGSNYMYMDSFLFPEKYFNIYSELLGVNENVLREVGELCTKPDMEKEILTVNVEELQNKYKI
jgi:hypothetical protein